MNTDVEELLRDGMERFTAEVRAPAGLAGAAGRLHRRRVVARTAVACGTAVAVAVGVAFAAAGGGSGAAQARTVAYVTGRVENALTDENLVFVGRTSTDYGYSVTWAYRSMNRYEEYSNGDVSGIAGVRPMTGPALAQGTALVGGKLVDAYVTYFNHKYSLWPLGSPPRSVCAPDAAFGMAAPIIPTTHWSSYIDATLACGAATVTRHVKIDGVETTKITGKPETVRLSAGYSKAVNEKFATARWTLYVNPVTYLPVRMVGSTETFGGSSDSTASLFVTNVQWLPPTRANVAQALVTIPPGFHRFYGPPGDQP